jgi:ubiquitin-protein ligase
LAAQSALAAAQAEAELEKGKWSADLRLAVAHPSAPPQIQMLHPMPQPFKGEAWSTFGL